MGLEAGDARAVQVQLEVTPNGRDAATDEALIALYGAYGEDLPNWLRRLEKLVNVDAPAAIGG